MPKVSDGAPGEPLLPGGAYPYARHAPTRRPMYKVAKFDNFHSGDDEEGSDVVGEYIFPGAALWAARTIVRESLSYLLSQRLSRGEFDTTAAQLVADWYDFGDSAIISAPAGEAPFRFKSSEYARELAATMCGEGG